MFELKVYAPFTFWDDIEKDCNGCGSELNGTNKIVPDTIWGLSILLCCCIHDHMYVHGQTLGDKLFADAVFLMNMTVIIIHESSVLMKILRLHRAAKYYTAVAAAGDESFFDGKKKNQIMAITYRGSFTKIQKKESK
jgi:hypothetical protein